MRIQNFCLALLSFLFFGVPTTQLLAQHDSSVQQDFQWVKLKDGSRIKMQSFTTNEDRSVYKLLLTNGEQLTVKREEIKKIKMPNHQWVYNNSANMIPAKGRYRAFWTGVLINQPPDEGINIGANALQFSQGLYINNRLSIGAGAAFDVYNGQVIIPVFFEGKYFLAPTKNVAPYLGTRMGMGPSLNWRARGGPMIHPHFGIRAASKSNVQVNLEFGVRIQQQNEQLWNEVRVTTFKRYSLGLGISF